jgi:hypothetical protein
VKALNKVVRDGGAKKATRAEAARLLERFASAQGEWSAMVRSELGLEAL